MSQAVMESLGPAAQSMLLFEQAVLESIINGLATAERSLMDLESAIKVQIATQTTPAILTSAQLGQVASNQIRQQLAQANEYVTSATGTYVPLSGGLTAASLGEYGGVEFYPRSPISPNPTAVPIAPNYPGYPGSPSPPPPPSPGYAPTPAPFAPPIGPGVPQPPPGVPARPWGVLVGAGPASPTPGAPTGASGVYGLGAPSTASDALGGATEGSGGGGDSLRSWCATEDHPEGTWVSLPQSPDELYHDPLGVPTVAIYYRKIMQPLGHGGTLVVPSCCYYDPSRDETLCNIQQKVGEPPPGIVAQPWVDPNQVYPPRQPRTPTPGQPPGTPSPTPTTPTPTTPTPTTPTPTPTTPTPTPTQPRPTPTPTPTTPTPTPTPQPQPTPTPTPTPIPPDCPPPPKPDPGMEIVQAGVGPDGCPYYRQIPIRYPQPPEPPPQPPQPPEPPIPPIPGTPLSQPQGCDGRTREKACFRAANPPDDDNKYPAFYVSSGHGRFVADMGGLTPTIDIRQNRQIDAKAEYVDSADEINNCTQPYQMSLVLGQNSIQGALRDFWDLRDEVNNEIGKQSEGWKAVLHAVTHAPVVLISLLVNSFSAFQSALASTLANSSGCLGKYINSEIGLRFLDVIALGALRKHRRVLAYSNDFECPIGIPSTSQAATAWLGGEIDICTFEAYAKANDDRFLPQLAVTKASKLKFSALELMTLHKRHQLQRDGIAKRLRELGSIEDQDVNELEQLFVQIPGPADLIRFMVRDTENPNVINTFRTDDLFTENFQGQLKDWAEMQGVSEDVMRREWRAHWGIPSPTQLYVMLHRLNHGEDPTPNADIKKDVRDALIQQDILPYWVDRLMAVSYHTLTRTDLFRAYEHGWIDDDTFLKGMYHNGYDDDSARSLLKFAGLERGLAIRHSDFVHAYVDGSIDLDQLAQWSSDEGYADVLAGDISSIALKQRSLKEQGVQAKQIAARYKACIIDEEEARQDAQSLHIPEEVINYHLDIAGLNTRCGTRKEMASQLCTALDQGLIGPDHYVERMRKLKFDDVAIQTYLGLCLNKIAARRAAQALKEQKQAEKAEKDAEREAERAAKQAQRDQEKLAASLAKLERGRQGRNKLLEGAVAYLLKNADLTEDHAYEAVHAAYNAVMGKYGLTQNESAQAVYFAANQAGSKTVADFAANADSIAAGALAGDWALSPLIPIA